MLNTIGPSDIVHLGTFARYNISSMKKNILFNVYWKTAAKHVKHKLRQTSPIVQSKTSTQIYQ
jgi:hypothetical protein